MKKVLIIGAGFSGMSLAYFLNKKGFEVSIVEKNDFPGGMIQTGQSVFGLHETAANGFLNTAKVESFLRAIGVGYVGSTTTAKKRFIFRKKPRRWPLSTSESFFWLFKFVKFIFKSKVNRMAGTFESVYSWSERNFGLPFTNYILAPALQGIYAGDLHKLSANLIINQMLNRKREKKLSPHSLLSGLSGMGEVMRNLENYLRRHGVQFNYNRPWADSMTADYLVIATSAPDALPVLKKLNLTHAVDVLESIEMLPLVTITCHFENAPVKYRGFGILFPRDQEIRALGVLMNRVIFNRNEKFHSETWIYGGALDLRILDLTDLQIMEQVQKDRILTFSKTQGFAHFTVTRWPKALPHYTIELEKNLALLKSTAGVIWHGNYLGALGLSRILEKSEKIAEDLAKAEEK